MGEITHVELDHLLGLADHISDTADRLAATVWPRLDSTALPGSAVNSAATAEPPARRAENLVADLRAWATAARASAEAFARAEEAHGARLAGP